MSPRPSQIRLLAIRQPDLALVAGAARRAFPTSTTSSHGEAAEIPPQVSYGDELWVAGSAAGAGIAAHFSSSDARGWRRPGLVLEEAETALPVARTVRFESAGEVLLAEIFRAAFVENSLRRENARLLGDLRTISSRIVHDLRSPLTPIFANVELLQMILTDAQLREDEVLAGIQNSAEDLTLLIERLSLITKNSTVPRSLEKVSLKKVVDAVREKFEGKILRAQATLREISHWPEVLGAPAWLELIYTQWMENSLRHAGPAPVIELGATTTRNGVRAFIRDHGPGVAAEKVAKLFQPFDTLHDLGAPRGLGLPLVQRLAELQGGFAGYQAGMPRGAEFFVDLPAA